MRELTFHYFILLCILVKATFSKTFQQSLWRNKLKQKQNEPWQVHEIPMENDHKPLIVMLQLSLQQIMDVDEKNQMITTNMWLSLYWNDYHWRWNPSKYGNITSLSLNGDMLWKPDILLYNSASESFDSTYKTKVKVENTGDVQYIPPGIFKSTCKMNVRWFPFDEQDCDLKFGAWTYDGTQMEMQLPPNETAGYTSEFQKNGEWTLIGMPAKRSSVFYECCPDTPYYDITFTIRIRRRSLYYTVNLVVPGMMISGIALLAFTLPAESGEKVSLSVTIVLSLTVFSMIVSEKLPETSDTVPLVGTYFSALLLLCALCVAFNIAVLNVNHRNPKINRLPRWLLLFIEDRIAPILCIKRYKDNNDGGNDGMKKSPPFNQGKFNHNANSTSNSTRLPLERNNRHDLVVSSSTDDNNVPRNGPFSTTTSLLSRENRENLTINGYVTRKQPPSPIKNSKRYGKYHTNHSIYPNKENRSQTRSRSRTRSVCPTQSAKITTFDTQMDTTNTIIDYSIEEDVHSRTFSQISEIRYILRQMYEKQVEDDRENEQRSDWIFLAMVVDRLCFVALFVVNIFVTASILLQAPALQGTREEVPSL